LMRDENLSRAEAAQLLDWLLDGSATDAQIAATLIALKRKGETVEELAGLAEGMRAHATRISCGHKHFIDTAGTGSSAAKTFNVSTAAAFIIAGAGLPVAKHGNRAASSRFGSADVLTALGVNISVVSSVSEACLNDIGICFMFAPLYHGATARVAGIRRELGVHTTQTLAALGTEHAWIVSGADGLDEITIADRTFVAEASNGEIRMFEIGPEDFGVSRSEISELRCDDAAASASMIKSVLSGVRRDAARNLVVANAAAALKVGGVANDLHEGARFAEESIDSGAATQKLESLIAATNTARATMQ